MECEIEDLFYLTQDWNRLEASCENSDEFSVSQKAESFLSS
jgi:hypothetical protein